MWQSIKSITGFFKSKENQRQSPTSIHVKTQEQVSVNNTEHPSPIKSLPSLNKPVSSVKQAKKEKALSGADVHALICPTPILIGPLIQKFVTQFLKTEFGKKFSEENFHDLKVLIQALENKEIISDLQNLNNLFLFKLIYETLRTETFCIEKSNEERRLRFNAVIDSMTKNSNSKDSRILLEEFSGIINFKSKDEYSPIILIEDDYEILFQQNETLLSSLIPIFLKEYNEFISNLTPVPLEQNNGSISSLIPGSLEKDNCFICKDFIDLKSFFQALERNQIERGDPDVEKINFLIYVVKELLIASGHCKNLEENHYPYFEEKLQILINSCERSVLNVNDIKTILTSYQNKFQNHHNIVIYEQSEDQQDEVYYSRSLEDTIKLICRIQKGINSVDSLFSQLATLEKEKMDTEESLEITKKKIILIVKDNILGEWLLPKVRNANTAQLTSLIGFFKLLCGNDSLISPETDQFFQKFKNVLENFLLKAKETNVNFYYNFHEVIAQFIRTNYVATKLPLIKFFIEFNEFIKELLVVYKRPTRTLSCNGEATAIQLKQFLIKLDNENDFSVKLVGPSVVKLYKACQNEPLDNFYPKTRKLIWNFLTYQPEKSPITELLREFLATYNSSFKTIEELRIQISSKDQELELEFAKKTEKKDKVEELKKQILKLQQEKKSIELEFAKKTDKKKKEKPEKIEQQFLKLQEEKKSTELEIVEIEQKIKKLQEEKRSFDEKIEKMRSEGICIEESNRDLKDHLTDNSFFEYSIEEIDYKNISLESNSINSSFTNSSLDSSTDSVTRVGNNSHVYEDFASHSVTMSGDSHTYEDFGSDNEDFKTFIPQDAVPPSPIKGNQPYTTYVDLENDSKRVTLLKSTQLTSINTHNQPSALALFNIDRLSKALSLIDPETLTEPERSLREDIIARAQEFCDPNRKQLPTLEDFKKLFEISAKEAEEIKNPVLVKALTKYTFIFKTKKSDSANENSLNKTRKNNLLFLQTHLAKLPSLSLEESNYKDALLKKDGLLSKLTESEIVSEKDYNALFNIPNEITTTQLAKYVCGFKYLLDKDHHQLKTQLIEFTDFYLKMYLLCFKFVNLYFVKVEALKEILRIFYRTFSNITISVYERALIDPEIIRKQTMDLAELGKTYPVFVNQTNEVISLANNLITNFQHFSANDNSENSTLEDFLKNFIEVPEEIMVGNSFINEERKEENLSNERSKNENFSSDEEDNNNKSFVTAAPPKDFQLKCYQDNLTGEAQTLAHYELATNREHRARIKKMADMTKRRFFYNTFPVALTEDPYLCALKIMTDIEALEKQMHNINSSIEREQKKMSRLKGDTDLPNLLDAMIKVKQSIEQIQKLSKKRNHLQEKLEEVVPRLKKQITQLEKASNETLTLKNNNKQKQLNECVTTLTRVEDIINNFKRKEALLVNKDKPIPLEERVEEKTDLSGANVAVTF